MLAPSERGCIGRHFERRTTRTKLVDLTVSHYPECQSTVVGRQNVTEEEAAEWFDEFAELEENGAYFFSVTPVLTEAVKIAWNFATTRPRRPFAMRAGQRPTVLVPRLSQMLVLLAASAERAGGRWCSCDRARYVFNGSFPRNQCRNKSAASGRCPRLERRHSCRRSAIVAP